MQQSPRVGLIFMRTVWSGCGQAQDMQKESQAGTQPVVERLKRRFNVIGPWVVDSSETLAACQAALKTTDMDMVLVAFQTWADDRLLVELLEAIGARPLVLWCYLPWRRMPYPAPFRETLRCSGPVSAINALGTLRNLDVPYLFTWGAVDDPRFMRDLEVAGRAAALRSALRSARFGVIPEREAESLATLVDESRLRSDFGPEIEVIPVESLRQAAGNITPEEVQAYLDVARRNYDIDQVPEEMLESAARAALGLASLAEERSLDLVALNYSSAELREAFQMRIALYPNLPGLEKRAERDCPVLYQPEADLGAATANYILSWLTGLPVMFLEFWYWDEALNQLVGGHNGLQNPAAGEPGEVWISRDYDFSQDARFLGAQMQMIARPGRVTLFQMRGTPSGWQAVAASGVCLESRPVIEGYPHALVRIDTPIEHFFNRLAEVGATQHWIMAYGSVLHEIEAFCQMAKIPLEVMRY